MGRKLLRGSILIALLFVIYVASTAPFVKTTVFWIAFCFSLPAFLLQFYTLYVVMKKRVLIKGRIYDFPLVRISALYLAVQFVCSLLLMGFAEKIPVFAAIIVETAVLLVAIGGVFAVETVKEEAVGQEAQAKISLEKMEGFRTRIHLLVSRLDEGQIKEMLQRLEEEVQYSNPVSKSESEEIEDEIAVLLEEAEAMALEEDVENTKVLCERVVELLRERDRICKHSHD